jgi:hypothetical protein
MKEDFKPARPQAKTVALPLKTNTAVHEKPITVTDNDSKPERVKVRFHKRVHWWLKSLSRKQQTLLLIIFLLIIGGGAYGAYKFGKKDFHNAGYTATKLEKTPEPPTTVASRMTGRQVDPALNNLPVTGVMIENSQDARPQSGLLQADLVYEAIAEGGITRFLALFQESKPDYIGPVRSVRPYYLDFLVPYDAALAHVGGSTEGLSQVKNQHVKDLEYGVNASYYDRIKARPAPHNVYTSRDRLLALQTAKGFTSSSYQGFARKAQESPSATPNAKTIDFTISSSLYNPHYDYDAATNSYKRSEGGKPHTDERSGTQIAPKVVIGFVSSHSYAGVYSVYQTTGSGPATIFQDGVAISATWSKADRNSEYVFKDASGAVIPLNPGQTWISLVGSTGAIKYTP